MTVAEAHALALQHHQAGRLAEAEKIYQQILTVEPAHADALHLLGLIAHQVGRSDVAVELIGKALAISPGAAGYHSNLGLALGRLGRREEAVASHRRAIQLRPDFAEAHCNLGNELLRQGHLDEAVAECRRAIELKPDYAQALNNLGVALSEQGRQDEAAAACREALRFAPGFPETLNNLGNALSKQGCLDAAVTAYRDALRVQPKNADACHNLGIVLRRMGRLDEACAAYRRALELKPDFANAHSELLLTLHYASGADGCALFAEHRRWAEIHAKPLGDRIAVHGNDREPERRLRVGYVSGNFREHAVAFFIEELLAAHDRKKVEVFCYTDSTCEDGVATRLRGHADHWCGTARWSDTQVADRIWADEIDILVDLGGHTFGNRLLVFARKPAPVQVTYLGYPDTTGMAAMDYRLTDGHADPPGTTEHLHSEELVRLPDCAWCFRPQDENLAVAVAPSEQAGHVTFGNFHVMPKITAEMLALWAKLLGKVPGSRLVLKNAGLGESSVRERVLAILKGEGIAPERVDLLGRTRTLTEHLEAYGLLDIALDTYPYHGTTTTCEAMWMGVPVVTLAGRTHVSRVGVSLLTNAGVPELIAADVDGYVELATKLAGDIPWLSELRATLRERMRGSVLTDGVRFARDVEEAYRKMWRAWCAKQCSDSVT